MRVERASAAGEAHGTLQRAVGVLHLGRPVVALALTSGELELIRRAVRHYVAVRTDPSAANLLELLDHPVPLREVEQLTSEVA